MATFHATEFSLSLPEALKDKTINIFSLTDEGPSALGVVISRDRALEGEKLHAYAERQLTLLQQRLPLFRIVKNGDVTLDGQPALEVDYTWQNGADQMYQRQVFVHAPASGVMVLITATCKGARIEPQWEAMFRELLADFRLRT